jgi:hypothetical protein
MGILLAVIWLHFLGDFVLQSNFMAQGKSKSMLILTFHVCVYTIPLLLLGWKYALINGLAHWVVDFFTSKATAYLYNKKENHWFFVVIGFDQALHMTILFLTLQYIF